MMVATPKTMKLSQMRAAWLGLTTLVLGFSACAQVVPIMADPSISPVAMSSFTDLDAPALYAHIDNLEYWAIPRTEPDGFYASVDISTAANLRSTLHDLIDNHTVFIYANSTRPGQTNHTVDTWDIIALADAHPEDPSADKAAKLDLSRRGRGHGVAVRGSSSRAMAA